MCVCTMHVSIYMTKAIIITNWFSDAFQKLIFDKVEVLIKPNADGNISLNYFRVYVHYYCEFRKFNILCEAEMKHPYKLYL